jgi:hypothetical protein
VTEGDLVFPNRAGKMHDESSRIFQEVLHRVLHRAGFARPTDGRSKHAIHFHSLRHTFACHWRLNGGPLDDLILVLGHTSKAMTEHYANVGGYHRPDHFRIFAALATYTESSRDGIIRARLCVGAERSWGGPRAGFAGRGAGLHQTRREGTATHGSRSTRSCVGARYGL